VCVSADSTFTQARLEVGLHNYSGHNNRNKKFEVNPRSAEKKKRKEGESTKAQSPLTTAEAQRQGRERKGRKQKKKKGGHQTVTKKHKGEKKKL
jgi:hypothetical protein